MGSFRLTFFVLTSGAASSGITAGNYIPYPHFDDITAPQFAVDWEIEERAIA